MGSSWLANRSATRAVLERHGFSLKHRLGQNFLVDDTVIARILALAELEETDVVLEVGPGIGTLSVALLAHACRLVAIEADRDLPQILAETCAADLDRLTVIEGDALRVTPDEIERAAQAVPGKLVSNLPYQVAATLILSVLETMPGISRLVVMVQAEVADRIAARPGTKSYGAYTAKLALRGSVTGRFEVGRSSFMPAPHVDSAVVRIDRVPAADESTLRQVSGVIDAAFAQRRKTLRNCLLAAGYERAAVDGALDAAGLSGTVRAETLEPDDFVRLATHLEEHPC